MTFKERRLAFKGENEHCFRETRLRTYDSEDENHVVAMKETQATIWLYFI
jgi:hypothetical protein